MMAAASSAISFDHIPADNQSRKGNTSQLPSPSSMSSSIDQMYVASSALERNHRQSSKSLQSPPFERKPPPHVYHHNVLVDIANNTKISQAIVCHQGTFAGHGGDGAGGGVGGGGGVIVDDEISIVGGVGSGGGDGSAAAGYVRNDLVTIVTISGCTETESTIGGSNSGGEMDVLAHL